MIKINNNKKEREKNTMTNNMIATLDYGPLKNDITHALKVEDEKILEINKKLENTQTKDKGTLELVQQRALSYVRKDLMMKGYYLFDEYFRRGPADLIAMKVENGNEVIYKIDVKGINPNANYTPAFKPRADKKFLVRDKAINRIVAIEYRGKIQYVEGYHENYKNLKSKYIEIK